MNGNGQPNPLHFRALTALKEDRLREMLANDERHLAILGESIEKQERFIESLHNSRPNDSTIIETARELLGFMKSARAGYIADCDRKRSLLEKTSQVGMQLIR